MRRFATVAFAFVLFATGTARASDLLLTGKLLDMRDKNGDQSLKWIVSDPAAVLPSGGDAPTVSGASLLVLNPTTEESATFILPASNWSVNGAGTAYKFLNPSAPSGPSQVKIARMKSGKLKVSARATGITLDETQQGSIGIVLGSGTIQYCTLFGGNVANLPSRIACPPGATNRPAREARCRLQHSRFLSFDAESATELRSDRG